MKIKIISLGLNKDKNLQAIEAEYIKRLKADGKIELIEIDTGKISASLEPEQRKKKEAELLLKKINSNDFIFVLDENGKENNSPQFSKLLSEKMTQGNASFVFLIGGAYGHSDEVKKMASYLLSLSKMTFTYQMSRLILIEQIYRAFTIMKNQPYHKL